SLLASCFKDKLHQRCRFPYIRSGEYIIRCAKRFGACGGYISGAGPTIMSIIDKDCKEFEYNMNKLIKNNLRNWRLVMLEADNSGAVIE
ncbi:MAG: homoserine kinase, partial [Clostridia bacterium]|nr:homoserine kinase [Clostridia bacterium]